MSLFGIIFYILIIFIFINAKKMSQSGGDHKNGNAGKYSSHGQTAAKRITLPNVPKMEGKKMIMIINPKKK